MVEASEELVARGVVEDEPATDAAAEGQELFLSEALGQAAVAGEDDAEQGARVEFLAGEEAELVEDGIEHLLSLVDDEDGTNEGLGDVVAPASAQSLEAAPAIVCGERYAEHVAELAIEVGDAALRVIDTTDDDIALLAETLRDEPECDGLSRAWVTGNHDEAAVGEAELDAPAEGIDAGDCEESLVGDIGAEGVELEAVGALEFLIHDSSFWVSRGRYAGGRPVAE
jgi:hypothetical protein